jgi:F-type H+-transporting ATPase subunit epsilon
MASATSLELEVITRAGLAFKATAVSITVPSHAGEFTAKPDHVPLMVTVRPGVLTIETVDHHTKRAAIGAGVAEVNADRVLLLVDPYATAESVDVEATRALLLKNREILAQLRREGPSNAAQIVTAEHAVLWNEAQLMIAATASTALTH